MIEYINVDQWARFKFILDSMVASAREFKAARDDERYSGAQRFVYDHSYQDILAMIRCLVFIWKGAGYSEIFQNAQKK